MTRVAAIDCGTNSIRLLVADVDPAAGTLTDVVRTMDIVRLGEGVDRTGRLSEAALERTFAACEAYRDRISELGLHRIRFVATSATRDAANRAMFTTGVRERLGIEPEVITGEEEASLAYTGATRSLGAAIATFAADGPPLVVDIGGGSTEFVTPDPAASGRLLERSVNVGCVRMTERRLAADPPTPEQVAAATADIDAAIAEAGQRVPLRGRGVIVGLAGSVTTLAAISLGLDHYDPQRSHGALLSANEVGRITAQLLGMTHAQRAAISVMHPGRVDVIGAGALILSRIMHATGVAQVLVSEHDMLDGIAWSEA